MGGGIVEPERDAHSPLTIQQILLVLSHQIFKHLNSHPKKQSSNQLNSTQLKPTQTNDKPAPLARSTVEDKGFQRAGI
jgi:hypothetical protein